MGESMHYYSKFDVENVFIKSSAGSSSCCHKTKRCALQQRCYIKASASTDYKLHVIEDI